jgi:hypothetical protein
MSLATGKVFRMRRWPKYASKIAIVVATTAPTTYGVPHIGQNHLFGDGPENIMATSEGIAIVRRQRTVANRPLENAEANPVKAPRKSPQAIDKTRTTTNGFTLSQFGTDLFSRTKDTQAPVMAPKEAKPKTNREVRFIMENPPSHP